MEHLNHPSPHFNGAKMARSLGGKRDNCSIFILSKIVASELFHEN